MRTSLRLLVVLAFALASASAQASWCQWILDGLTWGRYSQRSAASSQWALRYAMDPGNPRAQRLAAVRSLADTWSYYSLEFLAKHELQAASSVLFRRDDDPEMATAFESVVYELTARVAMFLDGRWPRTSRQESAVTEAFDHLSALSLSLLHTHTKSPQSAFVDRVLEKAAHISGAPLDDALLRAAFVVEGLTEAKDAYVLAQIAEGLLQAMHQERGGRNSPVTLSILEACLATAATLAQEWANQSQLSQVSFMGIPFLVLGIGGSDDPNDENAGLRRTNTRVSGLLLQRLEPYITATIDSAQIKSKMEERFVLTGQWSHDVALVRQRRFVRSGFTPLLRRVQRDWFLEEPLGPTPSNLQAPY